MSESAGASQPLRKTALSDDVDRLSRLVRHDGRSVALAALSGAILVVCLAFPLALGLNAWIDEAFTMHSTGHGVAYALRAANVFELQPPLYFMIEAAWRHMDEGSIAFARIPSICFCAIAVAVLVTAARRIAPRIPPFAVAAVLAVNPLVLWAASEMRVYALVLCIAAVLTWTFFCGFLAAKRSCSAQIFYVLFAIAGLYTQYYIGFLLLAQGLTLVCFRRSALAHYIVASAVVTAAFAPFVPTVLDQTAVGSTFLEHVSFGRVVHDVAVNVLVYVLPHDLGARGTIKIATVALTILLFVLVLAARPAFATTSERDLTISCILCVALFCVLFALTGMPDIRRHLVLLAPLSIVVSLLAISSLQRRSLRAGAFALGIYSLMAASALWAQYAPPTVKSGDWERVAATVGDSIPLAVFPAELAVPLALYRPAPAVAIPRPMPFSGNYVTASAVSSVAEVARVIDPVRARANELWLVSPGPCGPETPGRPLYHCRYVTQYFAQYYRLVRSVALKGTLLELYARKPA